MICSYCETNPVQMKRRPLCKECYRELHKVGLLNEFPLMEANKQFRASLIEKYGKEILTDFNDLLKQSDISMVDISKKHGFTKEYARQLFEKIFKFHFTVIKKQRTEQRKRKLELDRQLRKNPCAKIERFKAGDNNIYKGALAEKKVYDICNVLGYEIKPYTPGQTIDLVINNYMVDIKSCYSPALTSKGRTTKQFHFKIADTQREIADFIICYAATINKFFVIPIGVFPNCNDLYVPEKPENFWVCNGDNRHSKSHWYQYLEAWHLLKTHPQEIIFNRSLAAQAVDDSNKPEELTAINAGRGNTNPHNANEAPIMQPL